MSYLQSKITIKEFLNNITKKSKQKHLKTILNTFDIFCNQKYDKSSQQVLDDLFEEISKTHSNDKIYVLFSHFKEWLLVDHPEIVYYLGRGKKQKRTIKARHANTARLYLITVRSIFEEIGNLEINSRLFNKRVKIPKAEEEDPEPFTPEQMRLFLDRCSNHSKLKYMVLKDTGCRIGELVQLRKRDLDLEKYPVEIKIQARYTKTKKARIAFITRETTPMVKRLLGKKQDDELVFGSNEDVDVAKAAEKTLFAYYRNQMVKDYPEFGEIYQSNNRHKKTIHSIRSFTATQCANAVDETWGHGYVGHKKYLGQYIRNQEKHAEMFLRSENHLMVYEHVEVIDSDERVEKLELENQGIRKAMNELSKIHESLASLKEDKIKQELEIEILKNQLQK